MTVAEGDVEPGEELAATGDLGSHVWLSTQQGGAAGTREPDQDVDESAYREQAVLVGDVVAVVRGPVPQATDVIQRVQDSTAADMRLTPLDQVVEGSARWVALDAMVPPQLLEKLLRQLADERDSVLRIAIVEAA
ncbi:hypothetical protein [Streptomyces tubercidicus]|uniref:hypothetical protein n=1 Tax=Streptomyces tubercidicus TaxID=47759 RepID=UPI002E19CBF5